MDVTRGPAPKRAVPTGISTTTGEAVRAPMQATVVKVVVENGQTVTEGDPLLVLEAMKMEQSIYAHRSGVVAALDAPVGETVSNQHLLLAILESEPADA